MAKQTIDFGTQHFNVFKTTNIVLINDFYDPDLQFFNENNFNSQFFDLRTFKKEIEAK